MKRLVLSLVVLMGVSTAFAQHVGNTDWDSEESFRQDEQYIINDILWLEENPFATKDNNTKVISDYVIRWITETPYVSVKFDEIFTGGIVNNKKYKYSDKIRVTYLFGKSLYVIEHQGEPNETAASLRGLEGVVKVYREIISVDPNAKHKELEYYKELFDSHQLRDYVAAHLKKMGSDL